MELKLIHLLMIELRRRLLIVPYGIETTLFPINRTFVRYLLIVPYGIETELLSPNKSQQVSF